MRALFFGTGVELEFEYDQVDFRFDSVPDAVDFCETNFGPLVKARELLEPEGRWQAAHGDLVALYEEHVDACSRELAFPGEYLVALGGKT